MTFEGFPEAALDFYDDLEMDNTKTFWEANKHVYAEAVATPFKALAAQLEGEFGQAKIFRPYRDVRAAEGQDAHVYVGAARSHGRSVILRHSR